MKSTRISNSTWFIALASAIAVLVVNWPNFFLYWSSPFAQGWDSQSHASVGEYYSDHIFPSAWGWISQWYAGMPFPQFYPPLFFFMMAILHRLFPFISYLALFKITVTALQFSLPAVIIFFVSRRTRNAYAVWFSAISSVLLISSHLSIARYLGLNVMSVLHTGLVSQLLGFILFMFWLHFFLKIETGARARYLSGIFLFFVFLSNVHNAIATFFIFASISFVLFSHLIKKASAAEHLRSGKLKTVAYKHALLYILCGGIPLIATAFWTIPLFYNYKYFVSMTQMDLPSAAKLLQQAWIVPLFLGVSAFLSMKSGNRQIFAVSLSMIALFIIAFASPEWCYIPVPFHALRWLAIVFFMLPVLISLTFEDLAKVLKLQNHHPVLYMLLLVIIFIGAGTYTKTTSDGYFLTYSEDGFETIENYIKDHPGELGMTMVESYTTANVRSLYVLTPLFGQYGDGSSFLALKESSVNTPFMVPVGNSLSWDRETWGFRSYLGLDTDFTRQPISDSLDRAFLMGIQSFLIRSNHMKKLMVKDRRVRLLASFGPWDLFTFEKTVPRAEILKNQPVLFYGDLTFKERDIASYDWVRVQEELLFWNEKNIKFIYSKDHSLDTARELALTPAAMIASLKYRNRDIALQRLLEYSGSGDNRLIVIAQEDPLFKDLRKNYAQYGKLNDLDIDFLDNLKATILRPNPLRGQLKDLFDKLHVVKSVNNANRLRITETSITDKRITVKMDGTSKVPVPVLIKSSYFPAWKRPDGVPVYLASPAFMLTYATGSFQIDFTTPVYVRIGWLISLLTIALSFFWFFRSESRKANWTETSSDGDAFYSAQDSFFKKHTHKNLE